MKKYLSQPIFTFRYTIFSLLMFLLPEIGYSQDLEFAKPTVGEYSSNTKIILKSGFSTRGPFRAFITRDLNVELGSAPSRNQNYVITNVFKKPDVLSIDKAMVTEVSQVIQYFDGLGRPLQTIQTKGSPNGGDIVQPVVYDTFGREAIRYLPYTEQNGDGSFKVGAISTQSKFYSGEGWDKAVSKTAYPFSQTIFESSSLNKVLETGAPGEIWQPADQRSNTSGRTVITSYETNNSSVNYATDGYAVRLWNTVVVAGETYKRTLNSAGYYDSGTLYVKIIKDENWTSGDGKAGTTEEYSDKNGRIILKRAFNLNGSNIEVLSTYYVYDDFGNLSFVLPPGTNADGATIDQTTLNLYSYEYRYDGRRRVVEKRIPGRDWDYIVYNSLDQIVLSQDGVQRKNGQWVFNKYDVLGRLIVNGFYKAFSSRLALQGTVNKETSLWESKLTGDIGYSNTAFPRTIDGYNRINYYDDYSFPDGNSYTYTGGSSKTKGLLTGSKISVLGTTNKLLGINYYDDEGRFSKGYQQHYQSGTIDVKNYDEISNNYNFEGALLASTRIHHNAKSENTIITNEYAYDHVGRKVRSTIQINGGTKELLAENLYNEIGQLKAKELSNGAQKTSYNYNERGWLKSSSSYQFSQQLKYQDGTNPQYNGNVSEQLWSSGDTLSKNFMYIYDKLNRLSSGIGTGMSEVIAYDLMGNIQSLKRDDVTRNYTYNGNQLSQTKGGPEKSSYKYDENGNSIVDGRNGQVITYNSLNLPDKIEGLELSYLYDANGSKLKKVSKGEVTDYVSGIQYVKGQIELIQIETGIARRNGTGYSYEYNINDHLGNNRVTFYKNPVGKVEVLQQDDYYPFGLRNAVKIASNDNKYLYNGKEIQDELGQYDYGARFYDPVIGRWNTPDMLAELAPNLTPFRYCFNNPINYTDPFGLWERTANGYTTDKKEDIERFFDMMQIENHSLKNNPSTSQMSSFIDGEMKTGGLGTLSDGSKLAKGFTINQQRDFYGGKHWVTDQKSYNNFWHSVQGDLTPGALDPRTLGQNLLGTTYAGGDNPRKYNGEEDYSYNPSNPVEQIAIRHDLAYNKLGISGFNGLFNDKRAIKADYTFVAQNYAVALDPNQSALTRIRAYLLGQGLGLIALPKTIESVLPTMVNAPSKK